MKCQHCDNILDEYVEGLLMPLDRESLEAHLGDCERCASEAHRLAALVHALRELPDEELPEDFPARVMSALPERLPAQQGAGHLLRWGFFAAAVLLAFVTGLAMLPQAGGPGVARDTVAPLAASFQLGGSVLAHGFAALASVLDAAASELAGAAVGAKILFALLFLGTNATLAFAVSRYRHEWQLPSPSLPTAE